MRTLRIALYCALSLALMLGCGDARDSVLPTASTVGPAGGTVTVQGSGITLAFPAGAVDRSTGVTLGRGTATGMLPVGLIPGTLVKVEPESLVFKKPVTLTIPYDTVNLPDPKTDWLRMVRLGPNNKLEPTVLVKQNRARVLLSAQIFGGGTYALADLKTAGAIMTVNKSKVTDVDVLFVVDNSNSMSKEQRNLAQNFGKLADALLAEGMDFRLGVVSSDLGAGAYHLPSCETRGGDKGKLWNKPEVSGCTPPKDPWISFKGGKSNVPGAGSEKSKVKAAFACIARIGVNGCGFEQPLESARMALDPSKSVNPGFLRGDAGLAVVVISDEDDCSAKNDTLFDPSQQGLSDPLGPLTSFRCFDFGVKCDCNGKACTRTDVGPRKNCVPADTGYLQPVATYKKFFKGLKPAGNVAMAAIIGPTDKVAVGLNGTYPTLKPSCQGVNGYAVPAVRTNALVKSFGKRGTVRSICSSDFSPALKAVGDMVTTQLQLSWCLPYAPTDTNPGTPELDPDCVVAGSKLGLLPRCKTGDARPCFQVEASTGCPNKGASLQVLNARPAQVGSSVKAVCQVSK